MRTVLETTGQVCPFPVIEAEEAMEELSVGDELVIGFDCTQGTQTLAGLGRRQRLHRHRVRAHRRRGLDHHRAQVGRAATVRPMEHRRLGRTGLRVSSVGLGTMTWGRDTDELEPRNSSTSSSMPGARSWTPPPPTGEGISEEVIGTLLREHVDRQDLVRGLQGRSAHLANRGALLGG